MLIFSIVIGNVTVYAEPYVNDPNFIVEEFVSGLKQPTTMAFVGDDILVLERVGGDVRLVRDGILKKEPVYMLMLIQVWKVGY